MLSGIAQDDAVASESLPLPLKERELVKYSKLGGGRGGGCSMIGFARREDHPGCRWQWPESSREATGEWGGEEAVGRQWHRGTEASRDKSH